jgi:general secretion pathway protein C
MITNAHTIRDESGPRPQGAIEGDYARGMIDRLGIERFRNWFRRGPWSVLLEIALIVALGASLAYWTWVALAPRAVGSPAFVTQASAELAIPAIKRNLFGVAQAGKESPISDAPATSKIRLLGVLSRGTAGSGRAIFALETGRPKTVEAGAQIAQGYVLKEVHTDHVLVDRNGSIERIKIDRRAAAKN